MLLNTRNYGGGDPMVADMRAIVPIHNAGDERVRKNIKHREVCRGSEKRVQVLSSSNSAQSLRRCFVNCYQVPFDCCECTTDSCEKKIEYVIALYCGK
ncbi:unnamed protein product, partial [Tuber aestivum]